MPSAVSSRVPSRPSDPGSVACRGKISACVALGALLLLASPAAADISGTVFRDVDGDGVDDGGIESGVAGIEVLAFDAASNTPAATDTTATDGTYSLTLGAGDYRVEFIIPAALDHLQPSVRVSGSGNTSVVFATDGATGVDFAVINPGQHCQSDPDLAINCYLKGDQPGYTESGQDVLVSFPYDAGCVDEDYDGVCDSGDVDVPIPAELAIASEIGTTWGMAYQRSTDTLFLAAFQKRHSGFRAFGDTGLIYRVSDATSAFTFADRFSTASYSNQHGTASWSGDWTEVDGGGGGATGGNVFITGGQLALDDNPDTGGEPSAARVADLSGATTAALTFDFSTSATVDASDAVVVEASLTGGAPFTVLETFTGISGSTSGSRAYDLISALGGTSSTVAIRFRVSDFYGGADERFSVDNVRIAASQLAISDYADFDALGIATADTAAYAPNGDPHPAPAETCSSNVNDPGNTNDNCWVHDHDSYGEVGRMAFGDMDISDDESTLWTINLFDKRLYSIPVQSAAVTAGDIDGFDLPTPSCDGELQPFAVGFEEGLLYVGMVCDGPTVSDLQAYVYSLDPDDTGAGFTLRLSEALDYPRGVVVTSGGGDIQAEWNPWSDDFNDVLGPVFGTERGLPQPWLTDIDFDDGDLILGINDRFAHQSGFDDGAPFCVPGAGPPDFDCTSTTITVRGDAAGDTLRACPDGLGGWDFESNASCSGVTTAGAGNGEGPGGGEYYFEDELTGFHDETTLGGLYQVPVNADFAVSVYDPINDSSSPAVFSGGINWFRRADGERANNYRLFLRTNPNTFGKAGGVGDIEGLCDPAALEIGDRVWTDSDADGIQDPGEAGINGLTVLLIEDPDGIPDNGDETQVGSTITAGDGEYLFTDGNVTGGLQYDTNYYLQIDTTQAPLTGLNPTLLDATPVGDGNDDIRDSDGDALQVTDAVVASFTTGGPGSNRHIYDFGFRSLSFDWGDLPDAYGTLSASSGANHEITSQDNVYLGGAPDSENDGQPSADALDDDNDLDGDDEDGVLFLTPLSPGEVADIQVNASAAGVLNAWIDFNSDGDFADTGEQIASDLALSAGNNLLDDIAVPAGATGTMAARFRVTNATGQGGGSPTGPASTGEVEDYVLACLGDFVWNDLDGDGIQEPLGDDGLPGTGDEEPGIPGVTVNLVSPVSPYSTIADGDGTPITATTDADGNYELCGLPPVESSGLSNPGDYRLIFARPAPFTDFTPPDQGGDDTVDSDADQDLLGTGLEGLAPVPSQAAVTLVAGEVDDTVDAGLRAVTAALVTSAAAYVDGGTVVFEFSTGYEALSAGFEVYRLRDGIQTAVTESTIPALFGAPQGGVYRVADGEAPYSRRLTYVVVEHQADGRTQAYGPYRVEVGSRGDRAPLSGEWAARPHVSESFSDRLAAAERSRRSAEKKAERRSGFDEHRRGPGQAPVALLDVRRDGLYRVTAAELATTLGVPEGVVRQWISGGRIEVENRGASVSWMAASRSGDALLFYGEAIDSLYTERNTYWLRFGTEGSRMEQVDGPYPPAAPGGTFVSVERFEEDVTPLITTTVETEVDHWYWTGINAHGNDTVRTFEVTVPDGVSGRAVITARFAGASNGIAAFDHHAELRVNGVVVGTAAWGGLGGYEEAFAFDASLLTPLTTIEVESFLADGSTDSVFYVDGFDIEYPRAYRAVADALLARGDGNPVITVDGFSSADVVTLDLTQPERPAIYHNPRIEFGPDGFRASFEPSSPETPYFSTTISSAASVENLRSYQPQVDLRSPSHDYEHLVIAPRAWRHAAQRFAEYRTGRGTPSLAIDLEDVYGAFSHGIVTPWAIRDLLLYAEQEWAGAPSYVVLAGRGTLDPRDLQGDGDNFLPVVLVGTSYGLLPSDHVLADLSGGDAVPDLAIGRLPVISEAELDAYVDKLAAYAGATGDWRDRALLLADNPDAAGDFGAHSDDVAAILGGYEQQLVYLSEMTTAQARAALFSAWNDGVQLVNYVGHGGVQVMAAEALLHVTDTPLLGNDDRLPIVSALTCTLGRSDIPALESLAEALLVDDDGGAVAVWSPSGVSLAGAAHQLNLLYAAVVADAPADAALGDLVLQTLGAFGAAGGSTDMLLAYGITGDPAVELP